MRLSTNNRIKEKGPRIKVKAAGRKALCLAACGLFLLACLMGMSSRPRLKVYIQKIKDSRFYLVVDGKPFIVKGVCYNPIPIGQNHAYDWWSDPAKPWIADGKLMKEMGVNTIRLYQAHEDPQEVKTVIRDLYNLYGIRTILGHWLGFWEYPCPLYGDKAFRERIKKEVLDMVLAYKDEPGVLLWILGNENNYSCIGRVNPWSTDEIDKEASAEKQKAMRAEIYYSFIAELAREIHKIDINHPVALGNGELIGLEYADKFCREVDLVACIIYRGKTFGNLFNSLKMTFNKPVLLSEIGADAYDAYLGKEDQNMQAFFLESQWRQIYQNLYNSKEGAGNCLGGVIFEWADEWWKHDESGQESWAVHDTESNWSNGSYYFDIQAKGNKNMNEEWFGIVALSPEIESGLNKRMPRKSYYVVREFWKNPDLNSKTKNQKPK